MGYGNFRCFHKTSAPSSALRDQCAEIGDQNARRVVLAGLGDDLDSVGFFGAWRVDL